MSEQIIIAIIGAIVSVMTSGCCAIGVCMFGTKFVNASRELIRDSIIRDYAELNVKKEIPRIRRESIDRKMVGLKDMRPVCEDATLDDIYSEIRRWKIVD